MKKLNKIIESFKSEKTKTRGRRKLGVGLLTATALIVSLYGCSETKNYEKGEILLKLNPGTKITQTQKLKRGILGVSSIDKLNKKYGVVWAEKVFDTVMQGGASKVYQLELSHDADIEEIVKAYESDKNVEYAEPDYKIEIEKKKSVFDWFSGVFQKELTIPNDPGFNKQWGLLNMSAPEAWSKQKGDSKIVIAIIDTGVDYNHEDLKDKIFRDKDGKIIGWNFVKNNADPMDRNGHGTHCAGIAAAATNNKKGVAGISWQSKIMPVKGLSDSGSGYSEDLADSIIYAVDNGAHVLSNSWGSSNRSKTIHEAIKYAYKKGAVIVAAAGNSNTEKTYYPSGHPEVISVAATDRYDKKAYFSNYGETVDISAPGVDIYSSKPKNNYASHSGTSMAVPYIAGVAAIVLSENPKLDNKTVGKIIAESGDEIKETKIPPRINLLKAIENARRAK